MTKPNILFPRNMRIESLLKFSKDLYELPEQKKLLIGCGHAKFVTPTGLILLSKACTRRSRKYPHEKLSYRGLNLMEYANNLGFSEVLNLQGRPYRQGAFGGPTYIPISVLSRDVIEKSAQENMQHLGDAIAEKCLDMAKVVAQGRSEALERALAQTFTEIIRNTFEHAEAEHVGFCAQYWPKLQKVEMCISDRGIGLKTSLEQGKYNIPCSDYEAVHLALMPGVSSKAWRAKKKKASQKGPWDNAGYGLFFASQLFGNLGSFSIASGDTALTLDRDKLRVHQTSIEGTVVSLMLGLDNEKEIAGALAKIVKRAAEVKERLGVKSLNFESVEGYLRSSADLGL